MTKAAELRELLTRPAVSRIVGARDPLTARMVEEAGFDGVWVSSFELSATRALPDLGLLTMTECLDAAALIDGATVLPSLVDCDTGFGTAINLVRVVRLCEAAGIAGICVEDKVFPKRNSYLDGGQVLEDPDAFAQRVEAAVRSRRDQDFTVVARCEALIAGAGMDEAVRRAHHYVDAGADAVLVHSKRREPDEIVEFLHRWRRRAPVVVVPTTYYRWSLAEAQDAGVSLVIYANQALRASVLAVRTVLSEIHLRGDAATAEDSIAPVKEVFALTRTAEWEEWGA
ncbi:isocitrate lyase/phosphoenolpyruvate mutase family protein [Lentzea sp. NPDC042327]|uniref:isocitrate lyase/phosphoenolpyruvate mutase family protein n=1 Tax=Lentzea sp. NPDC042327 TaxID=3154801 RepID=UPI0033FA29BA